MMRNKPNGCSLGLAHDGFQLKISCICDAERKPRSRVCCFFEKTKRMNFCAFSVCSECKNPIAICSVIESVGGVVSASSIMTKNLEPLISQMIASVYLKNKKAQADNEK